MIVDIQWICIWIILVRLAGSSIVNYGRLEMYSNIHDDWLAVCDRNFNLNNANILCRHMGYVDSLVQLGSALGPTEPLPT